MEENGISADQLALKYGFFGAEPWTEAMRAEIERRLHLEAFDIYGLSEIIGPGVAYECQAHMGLHVSEDHFIPEIIDPDTGEVLPDGEKGELVFTCITKQALPLIRYRTRDVASIIKATAPAAVPMCV
jgi:phenylacetate-CoA ligase